MADSNPGNVPAHFQQLSSNFLEWFKANPGTRISAKITLTDLRFRNAGRGVVANTDISAHEELFVIPPSLVLQQTNSEIYSKISNSFADLGPWDALILVIIYEYLRGDTSPWFPYIQLLPTTFDTLMFWTPEELAELQGSAVVNKIGKQSAEENWSSTILPIMMDEEALFPLSTANTADREKKLLLLAHMAGSMIMAYAFDIDEENSDGSEGDCDLSEDDEDNPAKGMVPFADMLNADAHCNNARLFHENEFLIMKAIKDIKAGDEIFNDYGPLPRSDLLRMYGYITDNYSAFDVVEIKADLFENVAASSGSHRPYLAQKRRELESLGLIDDAFVMSRPVPGSKLEDLIPEDLRLLLTAFCQPAEHFHSLKPKKYFKGLGLAPSEVSLLSTTITNRLADYTSSLQEDSVILGELRSKDNFTLPDGVCQKRYEMAVQVRKGEKEILHHILEVIQGTIDQQTSQMPVNSARRKSKESDMTAFNKKKATYD